MCLQNIYAIVLVLPILLDNFYNEIYSPMQKPIYQFLSNVKNQTKPKNNRLKIWSYQIKSVPLHRNSKQLQIMSNIEQQIIEIHQYAGVLQQMFTETLKECSGYETISTFYSDLSIADVYGIDAVKDTIRRVEDEWFNDYKMFSEFVLALNHKSWEWAARPEVDGSEEIKKLYIEEYYHFDDCCLDNYKGEALDYYLLVVHD